VSQAGLVDEWRCIRRHLEAEPEASLDGVRVLVVDDHPAVRGVITALLEKFGAG
jgi:hypothetical protein